MTDLIELETKLRKIRQEAQDQAITTTATANDRYKFKIAAIEKQKQEQRERARRIIETNTLDLIRLGSDYQEVSKIIGIPVSEVARIEESNKSKQKFLRTGTFPKEGGYVCITAGLPTPR